jgi:HlyD family secretion protein
MRGLRAHRGAVVGVIGTGAILALAMWPDVIEVDTATVTRGPLVVTVDAEGRTRVRDRFVVSAPVGGRVLRIDLEPGDRVERGDIVARVDAGAAPLLDVRTRSEAEAAVDAARAAVGAARAERERASAALAHAEQELERAHRMTAAGALAAQDRDARQAEARMARETLAMASYALDAAAAELLRAEARLVPRAAANRPVVAVRAPAAGVILRRLHESEAVVPAGAPLVEIGEPAQVEIVSDLLSADAMHIRVGARALIDQGADAGPLEAVVRRIEPSGFTKVSALGVEEQRVNVILDLVDSGSEDFVLGDAYRVDVGIVVWEADDVVQAPTSALFRQGAQWAVYVIRDGRAHVTPVEIGRRTGRDAEVAGGLSQGTTVVVHPPDSLADGARVAALSEP